MRGNVMKRQTGQKSSFLRHCAGACSLLFAATMCATVPPTAYAEQDDDSAYYYWVNTATGRVKDTSEVGANKVALMKVAPDYSSVDFVRQFDAGENRGFGDIAVDSDNKYMYGIQYIGGWKPNPKKDGFPNLTKHDADTGEVIWRKPLRTPDGENLPHSAFDAADLAAPQANALSFDNQGRLLLASDKASHGEIFRADLNNVGDFVPVEQLEIQFPKYHGTQLRSAGDFVIGPDGALYGLASKDVMDAGGRSYLVRWMPNADGTDFVGPGVVVGATEKAGYGLARVGDKLLMALTNATFDNGKSNETGVFDLSDMREYPDTTRLRDIDLLPLDKATMPRFEVATWGATSAGEGGPTPDEGYLVVKKDFVDREDPTDQVSLWSSTTRGSHLMPEVTTSGAAKGLQPVAHREYVQKGSTHQLHEQLVDGAASTFDKYQVSVTCSAIDEHGNPTGEKLTPASPTTSGDKKSQQSQVVVSKVSRATTTCVFRNDPTPPEPPVPSKGELPFTGSELNWWDLLGVLGVTAALGTPVIVRSSRSRRND